MHLLDGRSPGNVLVYWGSDQYTGRFWADFLNGLISELSRALERRMPLPSRSSAPEQDLGELLASAAARDLRVVLFLDEFQGFVTSTKLGKDEFRFLRGLTQNPRYRLALVIATTRKLSRLSQDAISSEFANVFDSVRVGPIESEAAIEMVEQPAKRSELVLPAAAGSQIYRLCGGHPWLTACAAFELSVSLARGRQVDLGLASVDEWCARLKERLDTLFGGVPAAALPEIRALAAADFAVRCPPGPLSEAFESLLDTGLCRDAGGCLEPVGGIARVYLKQRLGVSKALDALATQAECEELQRLVHRVEPRLRRWLAGYVIERYGLAWQSSVPEGKLRNALETVGYTIERLGFGPLLRVVTDDRDFMAVCKMYRISASVLSSDVFHATEARNDNFHSRELSSASAQRAVETLTRLLDVLDRLPQDS